MASNPAVVLLKIFSKAKKRPLFLIAGPCVIEGERHARMLAERIGRIAARLRLPWIFKASYDKANRTSLDSYRGPGLEKGLAILKRIRADFGVPVMSDVHETSQVGAAAEVLDVLQIPAFLCRQTDLLVAAARTGKAVNVKKGQFLAPADMAAAVKKIEAQGNRRILLTERGASFGHNNLVTDPRWIPMLQAHGHPVVFDATHSVQKPGGLGNRSGGESQLVPVLARAAVAAGADGLFLEVHENPAKALSDGPNALPLDRLEELLRQVLAVRKTIS